MSLISRHKSRARAVLPAVAGLLTLGYFAYHAVNGDRGLLAYWRLEEAIVAAEAERAETEAERQRMEHQLSLLPREIGEDRGSLSLDMLDERARALLGHVRPGEVIIFDSPGR